MSETQNVRAGFVPARIIHLHPSRMCNLACKHCYSSSGPKVRTKLDVDVVISGLATLRNEGYEVLSLSGGEPLLYPDFKTLVSSAKLLGYQVNLISNGALVKGELLNFIDEYIDLIAVSLDGPPETHIEVRDHKNAFTFVLHAVQQLADLQLNYGISYCISRKSLASMPWVFDFALEHKAHLLQFHPFAPIGRGQHLAAEFELTEDDLARAYLIATIFELQNGPAIQLDIASVKSVHERRNDYATLTVEDASNLLLSDLINPLVIEDDGKVIPFAFGLNPYFALGQLDADFGSLLVEYRQGRWKKLSNLIDLAFASLALEDDGFVDWFYHIVKTSYTFNHIAIGN